MSFKDIAYGLNPSTMVYAGILTSYLFGIFRYCDQLVKLMLSVVCFSILYLVCSGGIISDNVFSGTPSVISWIYSSRNQLGITFAIFITFAAICSILISKSSRDIRLCAMQFGCAIGVIYAQDIISVLIYIELLSLLSAYTISIQNKKNSADIAFVYLLIHIVGGVCLLSGILLYLKEHSDFVYRGMWFVPEFWNLDHSSIVFLSGLLILIGFPPLCCISMVGYGASNIQSSIILLSTSTKVALFVTMQFFSGYEKLVWVGLIFIMPACLYGMLCTKIKDSIIGFAFAHIGIVISCLSLNSEFIRTAVSVDLMCSVILIVYLFLIDEYSANIGKNMTLIHVAIATLCMCSIPGTISSIAHTMIMHATSYHNYYIDIVVKFGHIVEYMIAGKILFSFITKYRYDDGATRIKIDIPKSIFLLIIASFVTFFSIILPERLTNLGVMFVSKAGFDVTHILTSVLVVLATIVIEMIMHRSRYIKSSGILLKFLGIRVYSTSATMMAYSQSAYHNIFKNIGIVKSFYITWSIYLASILTRIEWGRYFLILMFFILGGILVIAI